VRRRARHRAGRIARLSADVQEQRFLQAGVSDRKRLFCTDKVHMSAAGHALTAAAVAEAIERRGR
jgi:lysophospholipase L1-like esterase